MKKPKQASLAVGQIIQNSPLQNTRYKNINNMHNMHNKCFNLSSIHSTRSITGWKSKQNIVISNYEELVCLNLKNDELSLRFVRRVQSNTFSSCLVRLETNIDRLFGQSDISWVASHSVNSLQCSCSQYWRVGVCRLTRVYPQGGGKSSSVEPVTISRMFKSWGRALIDLPPQSTLWLKATRLMKPK